MRDMGIILATTGVTLALVWAGRLRPGYAIAVLAIVPVAVAVSRASGGAASHVMRLAAAVGLPMAALALSTDRWSRGSEPGPVLAGSAMLLVMLYGLYVMFGGLSRRRTWQFLGLVPLLLLTIGAGASAGIDAGAIAVLLVLIVAVRAAAGSRTLNPRGGRGPDRAAVLTIGLGGAATGIVVFLIQTGLAEGGVSPAQVLPLVGGLFLVQLAAYVIARGLASGSG